MKTYGNVILMATICIVIFWVFMALRPAHAQANSFFGPTSGSCCNQTNFGGRTGWYRPINISPTRTYSPEADYRTQRRSKTLSATTASAQYGACESTCQAKCQATWRAGGFPNVRACYTAWAKLNAMGNGIAPRCEAANAARGWRPGPC